MDKITGIHAVKEALEADRAFDRIVIVRGRQDTRIEEIVQLARKRNVSVRFEDRSQLDRLADSKDHQGIVGLVAARAAATVEEILDAANKGVGRGEKGLIVLLDGVEEAGRECAPDRAALSVPEGRLRRLTARHQRRARMHARQCGGRAAAPEVPRFVHLARNHGRGGSRLPSDVTQPADSPG